MYSACLSVYEWKIIDSLVSISSILFSFFVNSAANCSFMSDITLLENLCNFHTLSQNNLANPLIDVFSVVTTKYVILDNLSHTTVTYYLSTSNASDYITDNDYLSFTSSQNICGSGYSPSGLYTTFSTDQPGSISCHITPLLII